MTSRLAHTPKTGDEPQVRARRKEQTRHNLMQAALRLVSAGSSFTALGIREITREAGVVPTAFYRHFKNTDELGLALVEEAGLTLRRLLREARQASLPGEDMIRHSVSVFVNYMKQHHLAWRFVISERCGGSRVLRTAIRSEVAHFTQEMVSDLRALNVFPDLSTPTLRRVCSLVVILMMHTALDFLDLDSTQMRLEQEMTDNFVKQIVLIFLGGARGQDEQKQVPTHALAGGA